MMLFIIINAKKCFCVNLLAISRKLFLLLIESTYFTNKEKSGQLKSLSKVFPVVFRRYSNRFPPTFRRPLGGVRTYTAQWTHVHCPMYVRTLPSGRWKVGGKQLGSVRKDIGKLGMAAWETNSPEFVTTLCQWVLSRTRESSSPKQPEKKHLAHRLCYGKVVMNTSVITKASVLIYGW